MKHYFLFNYQAIVEEVREKQQQEQEDDTTPIKILDKISPTSDIEDLPFYHDYLSRFDVESVFADYHLAAEDGNSVATRDDLLMLFRFVVASLSSSYEIVYDEESNSVDLAITVQSEGVSLTKSIKELYSIQVIRLFEIYLNEQIELYALECDLEEDTEEANEDKRIQERLFKQKVQELRAQ